MDTDFSVKCLKSKRLQANDGKPFRSMRAQDQDASVASVHAALLSGDRAVTLPVALVEPSVSSDNPQALGITEVIDRDRFREALEAYRTGRADFADYLIGATNRAAGCDETVTFDRRLRGAAGFRNL